MKFILVALGGGLGASLRYGAILLLPPATGSFPYATLLANTVGSFLAGIVIGLLAHTDMIGENWRLFLIIGVLSSLTTFSTFSVETMQYFLADKYLASIANIAFNFVLCLALVYLGLIIGKSFG